MKRITNYQRLLTAWKINQTTYDTTLTVTSQNTVPAKLPFVRGMMPTAISPNGRTGKENMGPVTGDGHIRVPGRFPVPPPPPARPEPPCLPQCGRERGGCKRVIMI